MGNRNSVRDDVLERQGRVLGRSSEWFLAAGAVLMIPGILLILLTTTWAYDIGWVLVGLGAGPLAIGVGLLLSGLVARWAARRRSFA